LQVRFQTVLLIYGLLLVHIPTILFLIIAGVAKSSVWIRSGVISLIIYSAYWLTLLASTVRYDSFSKRAYFVGIEIITLMFFTGPVAILVFAVAMIVALQRKLPDLRRFRLYALILVLFGIMHSAFWFAVIISY
jgi:hypothetical protein